MPSLVELIGVAVIAAVIYAAGFGTGWKIDSWKNGAAQTAELKAKVAEVKSAQIEEADARAERDRIADNFEKKLANIHVTNTTVNQEVRHEVEKTVYGDPNCNLPVTGVKLRNSAIDAANRVASGEPAPTMPVDTQVPGGSAAAVPGPVPSGSGPD